MKYEIFIKIFESCWQLSETLWKLKIWRHILFAPLVCSKALALVKFLKSWISLWICWGYWLILIWNSSHIQAFENECPIFNSHLQYSMHDVSSNKLRENYLTTCALQDRKSLNQFLHFWIQKRYHYHSRPLLMHGAKHCVWFVFVFLFSLSRELLMVLPSSFFYWDALPSVRSERWLRGDGISLLRWKWENHIQKIKSFFHPSFIANKVSPTIYWLLLLYYFLPLLHLLTKFSRQFSVVLAWLGQKGLLQHQCFSFRPDLDDSRFKVWYWDFGCSFSGYILREIS